MLKELLKDKDLEYKLYDVLNEVIYPRLDAWADLTECAEDCVCALLIFSEQGDMWKWTISHDDDKHDKLYKAYGATLDYIAEMYPDADFSRASTLTEGTFAAFIDAYPQLLELGGVTETDDNEAAACAMLKQLITEIKAGGDVNALALAETALEYLERNN